MANPNWLDEEEMRAWRAFIATSALLDRRLDQQLRADAGLSHLQYGILVRLSAADGHAMRMTELADDLLNSKSGLTYQVSQLENAGLVERAPCKVDVRGVYAVLTDKGRQLLERAAPGHVDAVRELLIDVLTRDQITAIADGLGEACRRMLAGDGAPTPAS
ncbi:MarR family winged helix-turn-helix transcriptional regulator [Pengzhenrongella sp.]|jgi:DNA-binding MarR family transcriptional regulator|uniref:MarR family winged helix-turn-helix transcriptional regulator n=1 Tax=Pengzhenrongella sp. TaxID=2888820 RepID=UPI002F933B1D